MTSEAGEEVSVGLVEDAQVTLEAATETDSNIDVLPETPTGLDIVMDEEASDVSEELSKVDIMDEVEGLADEVATDIDETVSDITEELADTVQDVEDLVEETVDAETPQEVDL